MRSKSLLDPMIALLESARRFLITGKVLAGQKNGPARTGKDISARTCQARHVSSLIRALLARPRITNQITLMYDVDIRGLCLQLDVGIGLW